MQTIVEQISLNTNFPSLYALRTKICRRKDCRIIEQCSTIERRTDQWIISVRTIRVRCGTDLCPTTTQFQEIQIIAILQSGECLGQDPATTERRIEESVLDRRVPVITDTYLGISHILVADRGISVYRVWTTFLMVVQGVRGSMSVRYGKQSLCGQFVRTCPHDSCLIITIVGSSQTIQGPITEVLVHVGDKVRVKLSHRTVEATEISIRIVDIP